MSKLSDFKLAERLICKVCNSQNLPFKDVTLVFKEPAGTLAGGALHVGESDSLGHLLYQIVQSYVNNDQEILDNILFDSPQMKNDFLLYAAATIRRAVKNKSQRFEECKAKSPFVQRLYQRPLVWSVMKNIVCPLYQKSLQNLKVVGSGYPYIDVAKFFREGESDALNAPTGDFIFVNEDVENEAVKNAFLLIETLKAHDLSPSEIMTDLFSSDLYEKLIGIARLYFVDDESIDEFVALLLEVLDLSLHNYPHINAGASNLKTAQAWDMPYREGVQWWYFGILEKMLSPARGADWSTHFSLEPWVKDFWDEVEQIKAKKPQGEGVNFNDLLRLKHLQTGSPVDTSRTLQSLLSEQRIW